MGVQGQLTLCSYPWSKIRRRTFDVIKKSLAPTTNLHVCRLNNAGDNAGGVFRSRVRRKAVECGLQVEVSRVPGQAAVCQKANIHNW